MVKDAFASTWDNACSSDIFYKFTANLPLSSTLRFHCSNLAIAEAMQSYDIYSKNKFDFIRPL